ncbi:hypothetical protein [Nocardia carnea]|uniref:hypothetical protein n=1 Tax=Nocardia carnea TaxID=37328 RepID=UPI0024569EDD|nr:hypothetical protein [Nocardia carnea]
MTETDPRVTALNASIDTRLRRYVSDRPHIAAAAAHDRVQREFMREHQPEGGRWNALCLGAHDSPTPWPCAAMEKFDDDLAYMD